MNASTLKYKVLKLNTHLDCAEFSLCPNCSSNIVRLANGCSLCGWSDRDNLLGGNKNSPLSVKSSLALPQKIFIPCLVKQPKQAEVKGVIRKDEGDRFLIEVDGETITVSKLFVYPDFSPLKQNPDKSAKQIPPTKKEQRPRVERKRCDPAEVSSAKERAPSKGTRCDAPPSKNSSTKVRRKKGEGTGYIYRRTITRKGKQYQESYFRYRDESGKLKAKYIPQILLDKVQEVESQKKPIADILVLLGGDGISRGEQFSSSHNNLLQTSPTPEKSDELIFISRGEQPTPPSKRKRKQGEGTGYIECKPIKRNGKEYKQYWYHYEEWDEGDCTVKKSKYIPKRLVQKIERMNGEKIAVKRIIDVLTNKKRKK